jgi:predicted nucleic acid-binding protein
MNILDSSAWLEVLVDGPHAVTFLPIIEGGKIYVPAVTIFEVTKRARIMGNEDDAQRIESHMRRFTVLDLTADRASAASLLSLKHKLPMADSMIYAAALEINATLWTLDEDFEGLPQVKYFSKVSA